MFVIALLNPPFQLSSSDCPLAFFSLPDLENKSPPTFNSLGEKVHEIYGHIVCQNVQAGAGSTRRSIADAMAVSTSGAIPGKFEFLLLVNQSQEIQKRDQDKRKMG